MELLAELVVGLERNIPLRTHKVASDCIVCLCELDVFPSATCAKLQLMRMLTHGVAFSERRLSRGPGSPTL